MIERNNMNLKYDGIGLVNNRGISKYWGVTYNSMSNKWFISITEQNKNSNMGDTKSLYFSGTPDSEEIAAQISNELYKYRSHDTKLPTVPFDVTIKNGAVYTIYPRDNMIRRDKIHTSQLPPIGNTSNDLTESTGIMIGEDIADTALFGKQKVEGSVYEFSFEEQELIQNTIDMYTDGKLSKRAMELMKGIVGSME